VEIDSGDSLARARANDLTRRNPFRNAKANDTITKDCIESVDLSRNGRAIAVTSSLSAASESDPPLPTH